MCVWSIDKYTGKVLCIRLWCEGTEYLYWYIPWRLYGPWRVSFFSWQFIWHIWPPQWRIYVDQFRRHIILANFPWKLHKNKTNWSGRGCESLAPQYNFLQFRAVFRKISRKVRWRPTLGFCAPWEMLDPPLNPLFCLLLFILSSFVSSFYLLFYLISSHADLFF